jgi:hypothetical protein
MNGCIAFNQPLTLPSSIRSIGVNFLSGFILNSNGTVDIKFDSELILPEGLLTIGDAFLSDNHHFNQPLTIPSTVTSVGTYFLKNCRNMTSTITIKCIADKFAATHESFSTDISAPCYTTGITIKVPSAAAVEAIESRFPNRTSKPFRKLIVVVATPED